MKKYILFAIGLVLGAALVLGVVAVFVPASFREAVATTTLVMGTTALIIGVTLWGLVWIALRLFKVEQPVAREQVESDVDYRCAHAIFTLMVVLLGEDFFGHHVKSVIAQPESEANQRRFWTVIACVAIGYDALARLGHHHKRAMLDRYLLSDVLRLPADTPVTTVALFESAKSLLWGHGTVDDYAAAFAALRPTRLAGIFEELDYLRK